MFRRVVPVWSLLALLILTGCGERQPVANPIEQPLTLTEWQTLPVEQKYHAESYERLKIGERQFQDERAWERFYRNQILPSRARAFAGTPK